MHRLQGCLVDRSYAGPLDYRLDVSVVRNCVILEFFIVTLTVTACAFSRLLAGRLCLSVIDEGHRHPSRATRGPVVVQQNREGHDASCLYSGPQCINGHNNAL